MLLSAVAVYQIYVPLGGSVHVTLWLLVALTYPALSLLSGLPSKGALKSPACIGLTFIVVSFLAALSFSSDRMLGLKMIVWTTVALLAYHLGFQVGLRGRGEVLLRWLVLWMTPVALANIVFFTAPALELAFLSSPLARFLVEPDTLSQLLVPRMGFNVLNEFRAGTVFVNANVASVFFGMGLCIAVFLWVRRRRARDTLRVLLFFLAFLATGSRAGLLAATGSTLIVLSVVAPRMRARHVVAAVAAASLGAVLVVVLPYSRYAMERIGGLSQQIDPRWLLWYHTASILREHPLTGVGFGGWQESFRNYAFMYRLDPALPPHNAFMIAWLWGGILGLAGMLVLFGGSLFRLLRAGRQPELAELALLGSAITVWVAIQLMFTNFAVAEPRISGLFLLSLGAISGALLARRTTRGETTRRLQESHPTRV
jgi:O-antigen ligase